MAVYREGYKFIEEIQKASIQIFSDSADFGVPVKKDDKFWNMAKQLVDFYGKPNKSTVGGDSGYKVATNYLTLIDEWAYTDAEGSGLKAKDFEEKFRIEYIQCKTGACKNFDGFIHVYKMP